MAVSALRIDKLVPVPLPAPYQHPRGRIYQACRWRGAAPGPGGVLGAAGIIAGRIAGWRSRASIRMNRARARVHGVWQCDNITLA